MTTTTTAERRTTCRYLDRNANQCTAEAIDPEGEILICAKHAGRVLEMIRRRSGGK